MTGSPENLTPGKGNHNEAARAAELRNVIQLAGMQERVMTLAKVRLAGFPRADMDNSNQRKILLPPEFNLSKPKAIDVYEEADGGPWIQVGNPDLIGARFVVLDSNRGPLPPFDPSYSRRLIIGRNTDLARLDKLKDYKMTHPTESRFDIFTTYYFDLTGRKAKYESMPPDLAVERDDICYRDETGFFVSYPAPFISKDFAYAINAINQVESRIMEIPLPTT